MSDAVSSVGKPQRLANALRCMHPKQAASAAVVVGVLAAIDGRPTREFLVAGAAVLLVQLSLGLSNDLCDQKHDYRAETRGKPIASGQVAAGSAGYWMAVLVLLAVPVSAYNGVESGVALLATLPIGWIHNRWLHRTAFSFVGWALTFGLIPAFLSYGSWAGSGSHDEPTWAVTAAAAVLGVLVHFVTSLGDLVDDNKAGARNLPLRVALRIGAPRLLLVTIALTAASVTGLVVAGLTAGLRQ